MMIKISKIYEKYVKVITVQKLKKKNEKKFKNAQILK